MRRPLLLLALVAVALFAAACSSSTAPGWTYAPPTPAPTPGPSVEASAVPSAGASAAPSGAAPSDAAPSDGGAGGEVVEISAINIAFEQTDVSAPADKPFVIRFDNKEAVPHNVEIKDASGMSMFKGEIVTGPVVKDYQVPALTAGAYTFHCTVHPNMVGNMKVGG